MQKDWLKKTKLSVSEVLVALSLISFYSIFWAGLLNDSLVLKINVGKSILVQESSFDVFGGLFINPFIHSGVALQWKTIHFMIYYLKVIIYFVALYIKSCIQMLNVCYSYRPVLKWWYRKVFEVCTFHFLLPSDGRNK